MTTPAEASLRRLIAAIEVFRVAGSKDFQVQLLLFFLHVAAHEGCVQGTLAKATGMSEASVSRCIDKLGTVDRYGKTGMNLIIRKKDEEDYKKARLFLTPKGQSIADLIVTQMEVDL